MVQDLGGNYPDTVSSDTDIRRLEQDYIYQISCDGLYEKNAEALDFMSRCAI
jgi:hypothetical protein